MTANAGGSSGGSAESDERREWRAGHQGRDQMYYEELRDGAWQRIDIDGEMLTGRAHHVIYFASAERWLRYPAWARGRRDEIIGRITSEFREPEYEYHGLDGTSSPSATPPAPSNRPAAAPRTAKAAPPNGRRALLAAVLLLFVLSGTMGWLAARGIQRGQTTLPLRRATLRRTVARAEEPAMFWLSIGIYAAISAGALGVGALGVRELA